MQGLSSQRTSQADLPLLHIATAAQAALLAGDALVRKYSMEGLLVGLMRVEGRDAIEAKFQRVVTDLRDLTNKARRCVPNGLLWCAFLLLCFDPIVLLTHACPALVCAGLGPD